MPYEAKQLGAKWRIVEAGTNNIALREGLPIDGGGEDTPHNVRRAAAAWNGEDYQKAREVGGRAGKDGGGPFAKINKALKGARK